MIVEFETKMEVTREEKLMEAIKILASMVKPEMSEHVEDLQHLVEEGLVDFDYLSDAAQYDVRIAMGDYYIDEECRCGYYCTKCVGMSARDFM